MSKVGFISPDEIIHAGAALEEENTNYYLYNSNIENNTWTIGSHSIGEDNMVSLYTLTGNGALTSNTINNNLHIRPVINIGSSVIAKGEGTKKNPYLIVK